MAKYKYGRGAFEVKPNRIAYMEMIVKHPNFKGMPNARDEHGRINWQVSSGKTTSFYKYYRLRWKWWETKADELGLPGTGSENERFTVAARTINPTGWRPCLLCGQERHVGYFYLNANGAKRLNKIVGSDVFQRFDRIDDVLALLDDDHLANVRDLFGKRQHAFDEYGVTTRAFVETATLRSSWLSPGFMGNPPDRLDGLHDYCNPGGCRENRDPGRSRENMRSYINDRRTFEYWSEGDWKLVDTLYNSAGPGVCRDCGARVDRVSPDHIGPLSCGFKQIPRFVPLCTGCNSSKNRRMRYRDVEALIDYESDTNESAASRQVRPLWDAYKGVVDSDAAATELSAQMRSLQDVYLRLLSALLADGHVRYLTTLLSPEYALWDHQFNGLDPATFGFDSFTSTPNDGSGRRSLMGRSVRIAFGSLDEYGQRAPHGRRLRGAFDGGAEALIEEILALARAMPRGDLDREYERVLLLADVEQLDTELTELLLQEPRKTPSDAVLTAEIERGVSDLVSAAEISLA